MHTDGVSHADSLTQTEHNINCMNWVVGHMVGSRRDLLEVLGVDLGPFVAIERYARESEPILADGPDVISLARLLDGLGETQRMLDEELGSLSADRLAAEITTGGRQSTLASRVHFLYFHDTYHTGQVDLLRQISGKNDAII
jgi:hypothetical protein